MDDVDIFFLLLIFALVCSTLALAAIVDSLHLNAYQSQQDSSGNWISCQFKDYAQSNCQDILKAQQLCRQNDETWNGLIAARCSLNKYVDTNKTWDWQIQ